MAKNLHEIRDPIHIFVRLDDRERKVLDSRAFQRLRHIHQLGLTYLVYPGATHKRFEHSLGVMELAGRVFDVVTHPDNVNDEIKNTLKEINQEDERGYWRRVIRMAALCHDIGHLPFSHAAEKELLPRGWTHERLTEELILSDELKNIWGSVRPLLCPEDIVKLAVGPKHLETIPFSDWETILSEIIVGDAFGVDRMDYLLRDSHHIGVAYGKFDHYRLIDTLRILPGPTDDSEDMSEPLLGVEEGGIQSAEALMLARYFIYSQVYFHHIRRIYDIHLQDFLKNWLPGGQYSTHLENHLRSTDEEISAVLWDAAINKQARHHESAIRLIGREHFKLGYQHVQDDATISRDAGRALFNEAVKRFGQENLRYDRYNEKNSSPDFPVKRRNGKIQSSLTVSEVLQSLPTVAVDNIYVNRLILSDFDKWLEKHGPTIIRQIKEENENG